MLSGPGAAGGRRGGPPGRPAGRRGVARPGQGDRRPVWPPGPGALHARLAAARLHLHRAARRVRGASRRSRRPGRCPGAPRGRRSRSGRPAPAARGSRPATSGPSTSPSAARRRPRCRSGWTAVVEQAEASWSSAPPARPGGLAQLGRHPAARARRRPWRTTRSRPAASRALVVHQHGDEVFQCARHQGVELTPPSCSPSCSRWPDRSRARRQAGPADRRAAHRDALAKYSGGPRSPQHPARHGYQAGVTVTIALETLQRRSARRPRPWTGPGGSRRHRRRLAYDASSSRPYFARTVSRWTSARPPTRSPRRSRPWSPGRRLRVPRLRPATEWTKARRIVRSADGGETSVANCCLFSTTITTSCATTAGRSS